MSAINRRDFLKLLRLGLYTVGGALGAAGLARFVTYQPDPPPPTRFEVGAADSFPIDSQTIIPQVPALLLRDHAGFKALSMRCTHLGCTLEKTNSMLMQCPCHGSQFDIISASALRGPAVDALPYLQVEVNEEGLVVIIDARL